MSGWVAGFFGGVLIGLAAIVLLLGIGRIAGISGIVNGLANRKSSEWQWRVTFLLGMTVSGAIAMQVFGTAALSPVSTPMLVVAGLLVGFGTRLGNGCTSGHGVCGLGRLSPRSLVAVLTFMATAIITVFLIRHVIGVAS